MAHAEPEEADDTLELLLSCQGLISPCRAPLRHVPDIHVAQEDDPVLFGESEELLFEDLFKLLDCGWGQTARLGIGQITLDSLFHGGQRPRLFDFVSALRGDLVFPSQALGLFPGPCLRRDAQAAGTARNRAHDPLPATAATPGWIMLLWAFGGVSSVDRKHDAFSLALVQNWYKF